MDEALQFEAIAARINRDGQAFADKAMERAVGSTDIAIAILGVAVGLIIDTIDEEHRAETLNRFLTSFDEGSE